MTETPDREARLEDVLEREEVERRLKRLNSIRPLCCVEEQVMTLLAHDAALRTEIDRLKAKLEGEDD